MNVKGDEGDHQEEQGDDQDDQGNAGSSQGNMVGGSFGHHNPPWWRCLLDGYYSSHVWKKKVAIEPILPALMTAKWLSIFLLVVEIIS